MWRFCNAAGQVRRFQALANAEDRIKAPAPTKGKTGNMKRIKKYVINEIMLPLCFLTALFAPFTGCMIYLLFA